MYFFLSRASIAKKKKFTPGCLRSWQTIYLSIVDKKIIFWAIYMLHEHRACSQAECNYYNSILISKGKGEVTEASLLLHYHCKVSLIKKVKHCSKINETWLLYRDNPTCSFSRTYLPMMLVTIALSAACFKILWTSTLLWARAYTYSKPQSCFMFRPVGHKCRLRHKHEVNFRHTFLSVVDHQHGASNHHYMFFLSSMTIVGSSKWSGLLSSKSSH